MPAFHSRALLKSALLKGGLLKGSESWLEPHETRIERHSPSGYSTQLHYPTLSLWFLAVKILAQLVCSKLCQYCITCAHRTKKRRTTRQAASRYRAQIQTQTKLVKGILSPPGAEMRAGWPWPTGRSQKAIATSSKLALWHTIARVSKSRWRRCNRLRAGAALAVPDLALASCFPPIHSPRVSKPSLSKAILADCSMQDG